MGLLDKFIPSSTSLSGSLGSVLDKQISYSLAPVSKVLTESFAKAQSTVNDLRANFTRLTTAGIDLKKLMPAGPTATSSSAADIKSATGDAVPDNSDHKVTLRTAESTVQFDAMPEVSEVRSVDYEALQTPQLPGEFQKYKGTKSTQWTITGMFTCRTKSEALQNFLFINTLRGWTMSFFGENQRTTGSFGGPPPVIIFSGWRGVVGKVPVVMTSLNWNWPRDCDWISTGIKDDNGQDIPFPTIMNVNITIVESFSPEQFNGFNLTQFRNGRMVDAWAPLARQERSSISEPIGGNRGITGTSTSTPSLDISTFSNEGRNYLKAPSISAPAIGYDFGENFPSTLPGA